MTQSFSLPGLPVIAILRGLVPEEAIDIGDALYDAGVRCIEVPLNSPRPLESIALLSRHFDGRALIGAGTVLSVQDVDDVAAAGGRLVVSPNTDAEVIAHTKARGLFSLPGFLSPSEAFTALRAGADAVKLFPGEIAGPAGLKAIKAVLPAETLIYAVGGVGPSSAASWLAAGAAGLGVGSAFFTPGMRAAEVGARAKAFCTSLATPAS